MVPRNAIIYLLHDPLKTPVARDLPNLPSSLPKELVLSLPSLPHRYLQNQNFHDLLSFV